MSNVKLVGFDKLEAKLKKGMNMDAVKTVVKRNGAQLQTKAQENAPVVSGTLERSIELDITDGGMTAEVEPSAEYAAYVEYGTRYMDAQPYLKPAYNEQKQKFIRDLNELVR